ncbi:MAG TPA: hypothetical protein VE646_08365 [Actinomycetota bacterium]|jgi:hypothetical protein|nr:hypothetical protein [Actinomycetota bacterium]
MSTGARLSYVTVPHCHFCEDGRAIVRRLSADSGIPAEHLDWHSDAGARLLAIEPAPFPPALYLGDRLLGYGRLSERRLRKLLRRIPA